MVPYAQSCERVDRLGCIPQRARKRKRVSFGRIEIKRTRMSSTWGHHNETIKFISLKPRIHFPSAHICVVAHTVVPYMTTIYFPELPTYSRNVANIVLVTRDVFARRHVWGRKELVFHTDTGRKKYLTRISVYLAFNIWISYHPQQMQPRWNSRLQVLIGFTAGNVCTWSSAVKCTVIARIVSNTVRTAVQMDGEEPARRIFHDFSLPWYAAVVSGSELGRSSTVIHRTHTSLAQLPPIHARMQINTLNMYKTEYLGEEYT